jgi:succinate semialdehyde dehydrogenase (EC 1.2.1.16)
MSAISSLTHAISVDPFSGEQIGAYPFDTDAALEAALQRAKAGYGQWRQVSLGQRSEYLLALASTLEAKAEAFAQMISREIGKPIAQARGEVAKCVACAAGTPSTARRCSPPSRPRSRKPASSTARWARSWP